MNENNPNPKCDAAVDAARKAVADGGKDKKSAKSLAQQVQKDADGKGRTGPVEKMPLTNTSFTPVQHLEGPTPPLLPDALGNLKDAQGNIYRDARPLGNVAKSHGNVDQGVVDRVNGGESADKVLADLRAAHAKQGDLDSFEMTDTRRWLSDRVKK